MKKNQNDDDGLHKINLNATQNEKKKKYRKKMVKKEENRFQKNVVVWQVK